MQVSDTLCGACEAHAGSWSTVIHKKFMYTIYACCSMTRHTYSADTQCYERGVMHLSGRQSGMAIGAVPNERDHVDDAFTRRCRRELRYDAAKDAQRTECSRTSALSLRNAIKKTCAKARRQKSRTVCAARPRRQPQHRCSTRHGTQASTPLTCKLLCKPAAQATIENELLKSNTNNRMYRIKKCHARQIVVSA